MSVHTIDDSHSTATPSFRLASVQGNPDVHITRTEDFQEALAAVRAMGITSLDFDVRFFDEDLTSYQVKSRKNNELQRPDVHAADSSYRQVWEVIEQSFRQVIVAHLDFGSEVLLEARLRFKEQTRTWDVRIATTVYELAVDLSDLWITMP